MAAGRAPGSVTVARTYGIGVWLIAVVSIAVMVSHSWVPLDEGTTLLAARWAEAGALPHRDFAYPYTGGLAALHALTVRLVGDSMLAPRLNLLVAFALWLPAIWVIARRFATPAVAALTMLACAWWSVLVYPAAMPTWYLLFCATWATAALARWHDTGALRWVILAGVAAGVAIAIKQTGLGTLVGAGFGVLAIHQHREMRAGETLRRPAQKVFTLSLLAVATIVPIAIILRRGVLSGEALAITLPLGAVILALAVREWNSPTASSTRRLMGAWGALGLGALLPIAALVAWYAVNGAVDSFVAANTGGVLRTAATIERAMTPWPAMLSYGLPATLVIGGLAYLTTRVRPSGAALAVGLLLTLAVGVAASEFTPAYLGVWYSAQLLLPAAVVVIGRRRGGDDPIPLVVAAAAALLAINQVPYGAPNYFAYVAPLGFLAALAAGVAVPRRAMLATLVVLTAFGGWFHRIGSVQSVGFGPVWWDDAHPLPGSHGKLLVTAPDSAAYDRLVSLVATHSGPERFLAGPELGALYALTGTRRVVAQPYLLTDDPLGDSTAIAAAVDTTLVSAVAVNDEPHFLAPISASARRWIETHYPNVERVGAVQFRWR